jgi:uncharacterized protein (TIGR02145 family)
MKKFMYLSIFMSLFLSKSLNGQVLNSQEIGTGTNIQRNASFNVEEIKVRWKKAALENCTGESCVPRCGDLIIRDIDNNSYKTVQIGTQCWTKENLKVTRYNDGTLIPDETMSTGPNWAALTTGARTSYLGDILAATGFVQVTDYIKTYGYLYNWYAAAGIVSASGPSIKNICPTGWHVPSDSEWSILLKELDVDAVISGSQWESLIASGKMRDNKDWNGRPALGGLIPPDPLSTNSSGFTALPAGERGVNGSGSGSGIVGGFSLIGSLASFWSTTPFSGVPAGYYRSLDGSNSVTRGYFPRGNGQSIRCIKD